MHTYTNAEGETEEVTGQITSITDNVVTLEYENEGEFSMPLEDILTDYINHFLYFEDDDAEE